MNKEMETIEKLKEKLSHYNKFKLIDIFCAIRHLVIEKRHEILATVEYECLLNLIYQAKTTEEKEITPEELKEIIQKVEEIAEQFIQKIESTGTNKLAISKFQFEREEKANNAKLKQLTEFLEPFKEQLEEKLGFNMEDIKNFIQTVAKEYQRRLTTLKRLLKENSIQEISNFYKTINSYLFNFNAETFVYKDETTRNKFKIILNYLSHPIEQVMLPEQQYMLDNTFYIDKPIIKQQDTYIFPSIVTLIEHIQYKLEKEVLEKELHTQYASHKGKYLENKMIQLLKKSLPSAEIFPSVKYSYEGKGRETDILAIYDKHIIIIEAKGKTIKQVSKKGAIKMLTEDMKSNIGEALEQCQIAEDYIKSSSEVHFKTENDRLIIKNTQTYQIHKINVTLEAFNILSVQYQEYNPNFSSNMLSICLEDIQLILDMLEYETEFVDYLSKRVICNKYISDYYYMDEKYLWSEYKMFNLERIINPINPFVKIYDTSRNIMYDEYYLTGKIPDFLKGRMLPKIHQIILNLEKEKQKGYSKIIQNLLNLDQNIQKEVIGKIQMARIIASQHEKGAAGYRIDVEAEKELPAILIHVLVGSIKEKEAVIQYFAMESNKLKEESTEGYVIGILNYKEDPEDKLMICSFEKNKV